MVNEEKVKNAVNRYYKCTGEYTCPSYSYCIFGTGKNTAWDCEECAADDFAEGYRAALEEMEE